MDLHIIILVYITTKVVT